MIVLSLVLLFCGYLLNIAPLVMIGWILLAVGVILLVLGSTGRPVGGRQFWW